MYSIRCNHLIYVTLEYDDKFIFCLDNCCFYAEDIIIRIEKRTGMNFQDIPIKGKKSDFEALSFYNGGWQRKFWDDFPDKKELSEYSKMKIGRKDGYMGPILYKKSKIEKEN